MAAGIALLGGAIIGLIYKIINKQTEADQFNDNLVYFSDEDHEHANLPRSWKEIEWFSYKLNRFYYYIFYYTATIILRIEKY